MRTFFIFLLSLLLPGLAAAMDYASRTDLDSLEDSVAGLSLEALEGRRKAILEELDSLARFSMNSGVGRIGYRSLAHDSAGESDWIHIDFQEARPIDTVVLIPALWRDAIRGFDADGFPEAFAVSLGREEGEPVVVFSTDSSAGFMPRMAPFVIHCEGVTASWMRITATRLSPRKFDGRFVFQLSEVMAFAGPVNVALGKPVTASSSYIAGPGAWNETYLVDGGMPYLMDSAGGGGSLAFSNDLDLSGQPILFIDLGEPERLEQLNLHVVEQTDTVPQAFPGDYGIPYHFVLEGSTTADFSEPVTLLEYERERILDAAPVVSFNLAPALCRYVRMVVHESYVFHGIDEGGNPLEANRLGFAEIELLSNGVNVARGKLFESNFDPGSAVRRIDTLTDGKNLYGHLLPIKDWTVQLAKRHDLQVELPLVNRELEVRYDQQKQNLYRLKLTLGALGLVAITVFFIYRSRQQRAIYRTRERITADLHDVLGGNISAIAMLGQMADPEKQDARELAAYIDRIENLAGRTRNALKYISNMLAQPGLYENLLTEMERISQGLTEGLEHEFQHSGDNFISRIQQKNRIDIFLFYKECLVNIIRHSGASRINVNLRIDERMLELTVEDNGMGLPGDDKPAVPGSLRRRARILGARVSASRSESGGASIRLLFRWNLPWPLAPFRGLFY